MSELEDSIRRIVRDELRRLVTELDQPEYQKTQGIPWPQPIPSTSGTTTCLACGLQAQGAMGYCCTRTDCPMGMGSVLCGGAALGGTR